MSQVNFDFMSDAELRQHFLANRQDQTVSQAYLDRFSQRSKSVIAKPSDPDFDDKIQAAIRQQLAVSSESKSTPVAFEQKE